MKKRIQILNYDLKKFKALSRHLSEKAQHRENLTIQPKEKVAGTKVSINMENLLGGFYHMTADEGIALGDRFYLIEKKHSTRNKLPSFEDIKDSLLKMALFTNINRLKLGQRKLLPVPVVGLTSPAIKGVMHSRMSKKETEGFIQANQLSATQQKMIKEILDEARHNRFNIFIVNANETKQQQQIITQFMPNSVA